MLDEILRIFVKLHFYIGRVIEPVQQVIRISIQIKQVQLIVAILVSISSQSLLVLIVKV